MSTSHLTLSASARASMSTAPNLSAQEAANTIHQIRDDLARCQHARDTGITPASEIARRLVVIGNSLATIQNRFDFTQHDPLAASGFRLLVQSHRRMTILVNIAMRQHSASFSATTPLQQHAVAPLATGSNSISPEAGAAAAANMEPAVSFATTILDQPFNSDEQRWMHYRAASAPPRRADLTAAERENWVRAEGDIPERLARELEHAQAQMNAQAVGAFRYQHVDSSHVDDHGNFDMQVQDEFGHTSTVKLQVHQANMGGYTYGVCHMQGRRGSMEDEHLAISFNVTIGGRVYPVQLFGIMDGHGGALCAQYVKNNLQQVLAQNLTNRNTHGLSDTGIWNALKLTCVELNQNFKTAHGNGTPLSVSADQGSTGTFAMILDGKLWTANVGDSRTVLDNNGTAIQLSEDAKPNAPRYQRGVEHRGGSVNLVYRTMRVNYDLAVARSFGDHRLDGAISARPKITVKLLSEIQPGSQLLLACDGVYDVASTTQVVAAAHANRSRTAGQLAADIAGSAYHSGSADNISAMVVRFPPMASSAGAPAAASAASTGAHSHFHFSGPTASSAGAPAATYLPPPPPPPPPRQNSAPATTDPRTALALMQASNAPAALAAPTAAPINVEGTTNLRRYSQQHPEAASSAPAVAGQAINIIFGAAANNTPIVPYAIDVLFRRGSESYQDMLRVQGGQAVIFSQIAPAQYSQYYRNLQTAAPAYLSQIEADGHLTFARELARICARNRSQFPVGATITRINEVTVESLAVVILSPTNIVIFDPHGVRQIGRPETSAYAETFTSLDSAAQFLARRMPYSGPGEDELLDREVVFEGTFAQLRHDQPRATDRDLRAQAEALTRTNIADTERQIAARNRLEVCFFKPRSAATAAGNTPVSASASATVPTPVSSLDQTVPQQPLAHPTPRRPVTPVPTAPTAATSAADVQATAGAAAGNIYDEMEAALRGRAATLRNLRSMDPDGRTNLEVGQLYYGGLNPLETRIRIIRGIQELERRMPELLRRHAAGEDLAGIIMADRLMNFTIHTEFRDQVPTLLQSCCESLKNAFRWAQLNPDRMNDFLIKAFCDPTQEKNGGGFYDIESCLEERLMQWGMWSAGAR